MGLGYRVQTGGAMIDICSSHLVPADFSIITLPAYTPNRSRRLWKKLNRNLRHTSKLGYQNVWFIQGRAYCHPTVWSAIRQSSAFKEEPAMTGFSRLAL